LMGEFNDSVFMGDNGYNMAFSKRKEVWKSNTFAASKPAAIRECRCD